MRPGATARRRIERVRLEGDDALRRTREDLLAVEEPLEIRIVRARDAGRDADAAAHRVSVTMRTPGADFELAAGFLFGEGLIGGADDVARIRYCTDAPQQYNTVSVHLAPGRTGIPPCCRATSTRPAAAACAARRPSRR